MAQSGFDRRRVNGPNESLQPVYDDGIKESNVLYKAWKPGEARRKRQAKDIRPICARHTATPPTPFVTQTVLKTGFIKQANGSAYIETEHTKVACAVYGPRQSKSSSYHEIGRLSVEVKFTPFSSLVRRVPIRDAEDRSVANLIQQALTSSVRLDLLPKSVIDIFVTVIECDGIESCIAAATVAASTSLAKAGIEMLGLVISCSGAVVGDDVWLDPNEEETQLASGILLCACMPALGVMTNVWQTGCLPLAKAFQSLQLCQERCIDIHQIAAQALHED
ncbi:ribosomal protein S5 domain 2-like protein [Multifurca ochricompacta]|uniref:Ribosomal protein S5 domain 2-like protein n=1 Tax=Multifurca ochricompacta TaxID=376703 RepID=A0AAD4MAB1_9AGAM|nr:ribosomal protein S5 domain 2-like protein [Multifurca ochricompacta]